MSEKQIVPISEDAPIAIHFSAHGKTEAFDGIVPSEFQKKQLSHSKTLGYILIAFDAFEIGAGIITGFSWDDYLMIGAISLASIASFMSRGKRHSNFFQIQEDKITFSRIADHTSLTATMIQFKLVKPTILAASANEIQKIDLMLDEAQILLNNGKKESMNLANLDSKHIIQDLLMAFCEKHHILCQFSSLAENERKKR